MVDNDAATSRMRLIDRAVTALSRSTEALLRAADEQSLLDDVCRIAVEIAGYRLAWVGLSRPDQFKTVMPVAQGGTAQEYVQRIKVSWGDGDLGRGPVGTAIRTGTIQIVTDTETDPHFTPWRDAARKHDFRSVIALPLEREGAIIGALAIYASEPDAFFGDVLRLLEDLAHNLSYGITSLRVKTEHERAVRELAESEERYRSLVDMIPDAILVQAQGTLVFANPASATIFGAPSPGSLAGRPLDEFVCAEDRAAMSAWLAKPTDTATTIDCRMKRMDGTQFDAEVVETAITFHGLPARLLVMRDVTKGRQLQQQMVQTAKLATLGEMAAGLVHELSQPLNIMRLSAEGALLFIERGKATPQWQAQQFELIAEQAQRTAEIIDNIRIFSRRDTTPDITFDALAPLQSAIATLEGQLRPDGILLQVTLPSEPKPVRGRPVQLEQVILNLLSNAHHAVMERSTGDPDHVPRIGIDARAEDGSLVITVSDNGPGLAPNVRARIFEPFFTTKGPGHGTGLGLSISFGIVAAMGGTLEVIDRPDGACFAVTLPLDRAKGANPKPATPAAPAFDAIPQGAAEAHIMVVDDEEAAAQALAHNLGEFGYRVTLRTSGSAAFDCFMSDPADVVITDLRMPAGNGEQLVEKLRDYDPLLPVIIVTGHPVATEVLSDSLRDDRCIILKKPVAMGRLTDVITTLLQPPDALEET